MHAQSGVNFGAKAVNCETRRILRKYAKRNIHSLKCSTRSDFLRRGVNLHSQLGANLRFHFGAESKYHFGTQAHFAENAHFPFISKFPGFRAKSPYGRKASRRNSGCNVGHCSDSRAKMEEWGWKVIAILPLNRSDSRERNTISSENGIIFKEKN